MIDDDLIDLDELCRLGRMGKDAYRHQRRQGRTPQAYRIGRKLFFRRSDALDWLETVRVIPVIAPAATAAGARVAGASFPPEGGAGAA